MYQHGATVRGASTSTDTTTTIPVDDVAELSPGTAIVIFTRDPVNVPGSTPPSQSSAISRTVTAVVGSSIVVDKIGVAIPQWSGIRLAGDASAVHNAPNDLLEEGYGRATNGSDGGAFLEFVRPIQGSRSVPHLTSFSTEIQWLNYASHWFNNPGSGTNTFQLLTAQQFTNSPDDTFGLTADALNLSTVFVRSARIKFTVDANRETVVHELAHQFPPLNIKGENGHVDLEASEHYAPNILNSTSCIMTYGLGGFLNGSKFDILCYEDLRRAGGRQ